MSANHSARSEGINGIYHFQYKKSPKIILNLQRWYFPKGLKSEFETAMVNEPSVFEPLKFYCNEKNNLLKEHLLDWQYKYPEKRHNNSPYQILSRLVYSILTLCPLQPVQGWGLLINIAQHFSFLSAVILKKIQHDFLSIIYKKIPLKNLSGRFEPGPLA